MLMWVLHNSFSFWPFLIDGRGARRSSRPSSRHSFNVTLLCPSSGSALQSASMKPSRRTHVAPLGALRPLFHNFPCPFLLNILPPPPPPLLLPRLRDPLLDPSRSLSQSWSSLLHPIFLIVITLSYRYFVSFSLILLILLSFILLPIYSPPDDLRHDLEPLCTPVAILVMFTSLVQSPLESIPMLLSLALLLNAFRTSSFPLRYAFILLSFFLITFIVFHNSLPAFFSPPRLL